MNAPPQTDGLIEFDDTPPQAEFISCYLKIERQSENLQLEKIFYSLKE